MNRSSIDIGTLMSSRGTSDVLVCDDPRLRRHLARPWLRAYVAERLNTTIGPIEPPQSRRVFVSDAQSARHTLLVGATGSGKSRTLLRLVVDQIRAGCSVVLLDPKGETVDCLLSHAVLAGIPPERVTLLDPSRADGIPGWNPLHTGVRLTQATADFVGLLEKTSSSWGPRLSDMLTNALLLVGSHPDLSLYELARMLLREDYREALLRSTIRPEDPIAYAEAHSYFQDEFGSWGRSERTGAVSPVMNKIRELLRSHFLRPLLCSRKNTLVLSRLWKEPCLVLARLDRTSLGEEGMRLLAGLLVHQLLRTALRTSGPVPVVLAVDEMPVLERFVGSALADIVTVARSQGLRCILAAQHLEQVSEALRAAVLANAAVQFFLRLGHADARIVAASLAAGTGSSLARANLVVDREDRETGEAETALRRHVICDGYGRPLRLDPPARSTSPQRFTLDELHRVARSALVGRLYVRSADTGEPVELRRYVEGLTPEETWIEGPSLHLVVSFPRPRVTRSERTSDAEAARDWTRILQELPVQHAVLRLSGSPVGTLRVVDVPTPEAPGTSLQEFVRASVAANGQTADEIAAVLRWRHDRVEQLGSRKQSGVPEPSESRGISTRSAGRAGTGAQRLYEEAPDGSLA